MKVITFPASKRIYSSHAYLIMGDWNRIDDVNTLIDTGSDPQIVDKIMAVNTGLGKRKIDHVILTHGHSDHVAALPAIKEAFSPKVFAFSPFIDGVDVTLRHGDRLRIGDRMCDILHFPGHSEDSICIHNPEDGDLFAGDTALILSDSGGSYDRRYYDRLTALCRKKVQAIYFGHGQPLFAGAKQSLIRSLTILGCAYGLRENPAGAPLANTLSFNVN